MKNLHYAVVVGINCYPDIRHLNFARQDAEAFARWLQEPHGGGLPKKNIGVVKATADARRGQTRREQAVPTRARVFKMLYKFRKEVDAHLEEHPEDWEQTRLYFYFSGHGIAPVPRDAALLMADAGSDWYGENISCAKLLDFFITNQPFHEIVVFADCCREYVGNAPLGDVPWTLVKRDNGHVLSVLGCATYFGDIAYEPSPEENANPDQQRGYFTQALLEGLKGQAVDDPITGVIDSNSLANYVRQRVQDLTEHRKYPQKPEMPTDPAAPIIFRQQAQPQHEVRLKFVTPYAGKAQLHNGHNDCIGEHEVAEGEWVKPLANGLYQVTPKDGVTGVKFRNDGFFKVWGEPINVEL
jgi:uncharacterized caspase-like protein